MVNGKTLTTTITVWQLKAIQQLLDLKVNHFYRLGIELHIRCYSPHFSFQNLNYHDPRSIIFTSGTLSPMDTFNSEFGMAFKIQKSFPHVINPSKQVYSVICQATPSGTKLNFSYASRSNENLVNDLGQFLKVCFHVVPKGMLVFFTSYAMMNSYIDAWKMSGLLGELQSVKKVCVESSKNAAHFKTQLQLFINSYKREGAALFGVFGGKLSEGMDFSDDMARAVILIGIPFANVKSLSVGGKREYLDKLRNVEKNIDIPTKDGGIKRFPRQTGTEWYTAQAVRTYNQAIGRVIRHRGDYGAALLLDERFGWDKFKCQISEWAQTGIKIVASTRTALDELKEFYNTAPIYCSSMRLPTKAIDEAKFVKDSTSRLIDLMNKGAADDGIDLPNNTSRIYKRNSEMNKDAYKNDQFKQKVYRRYTDKATDDKDTLGDLAGGQNKYKRKFIPGKYGNKWQNQSQQSKEEPINAQISSLLQGQTKITDLFKPITSMDIEAALASDIQHIVRPSQYSDKMDGIFKHNQAKIKQANPKENIEKEISLNQKGEICINGQVSRVEDQILSLKDIEKIADLKQQCKSKPQNIVPRQEAAQLFNQSEPKITKTGNAQQIALTTTANQDVKNFKASLKNLSDPISTPQNAGQSFQSLIRFDPIPNKAQSPSTVLATKGNDSGPKWTVSAIKNDELPFFKQRTKK